MNAKILIDAARKVGSKSSGFNKDLARAIVREKKDVFDTISKYTSTNKNITPTNVTDALLTKKGLATSTAVLGGGALLADNQELVDFNAENVKDGLLTVGTISALLATGAIGTRAGQKVLNKLYNRKGGNTTAKVMQNMDINLPGYYSGGKINKIGALVREAPRVGGRLVNQFFNLGVSRGQNITGIGLATRESISVANRARLVAKEAGDKYLNEPYTKGLIKQSGSRQKVFLDGKQTTLGDVTKKAIRKGFDSTKEAKAYRQSEKIAHYNLEKDYMMLKKANRKIPSPLKTYMKPYMKEVNGRQMMRELGGKDRMKALLSPWDSELKGVFTKGNKTKFILNTNKNPDSLNWAMMRDPVYHNLMVDIQAKKGLYFSLDDVWKYGKTKNLKMEKLDNGNILLNYSPRAKPNYLKGGTNAMVEFSQPSKRVRVKFTNTDVFDLFKAPIGDNVIVITKPYKPSLKSLNFTEKSRKTASSAGRSDLGETFEPTGEIFDVDARFANIKPKGVVSQKQRQVMHDINRMAKDATDGYTKTMDPKYKERLLRRAIAGITLGIPIGGMTYILGSDD